MKIGARSGSRRAPRPQPQGMPNNDRIASAAPWTGIAAAFLALCPLRADTVPPRVATFIDDRCANCHDDDEKKGGLDLTSLPYNPADAVNFAEWVKVFDRVSAN